MELIAVLSFCSLMNFLGVYMTTDAVPLPATQTAAVGVMKSNGAQSPAHQPGSLMEELMALNENKL